MIEILSRSIAHAGGVHLPEGVSITRASSAYQEQLAPRRRSFVFQAIGRLLRRTGREFTRLGSALEGPTIAECRR